MRHASCANSSDADAFIRTNRDRGITHGVCAGSNEVLGAAMVACESPLGFPILRERYRLLAIRFGTFYSFRHGFTSSNSPLPRTESRFSKLLPRRCRGRQ